MSIARPVDGESIHWTSGFSDSVTSGVGYSPPSSGGAGGGFGGGGGAAVEAAVSDVIRNPCHFSIAFVFAYNRE